MLSLIVLIGNKPCRQCLRTEHPDICFYPDTKRRRVLGKKPQETSNGRKSSSQAVGSPTTDGASGLPNGAVTATPDHLDVRRSSGNEDHESSLGFDVELRQWKGTSHIASAISRTQMGRSSLAALIREKLSEQHPLASDDVRPSLGLVNLHEQEHVSPFFSLSKDTDELTHQCVKRSEMLESVFRANFSGIQTDSAHRFFSVFQSHVAPFYAIVEDTESFQVLVFDLLDGVEKLQSENTSRLASFLKHSSCQIALALILLALGAQFSHLSSVKRARQGQDFGNQKSDMSGFALMLISFSTTFRVLLAPFRPLNQPADRDRTNSAF